MKSLRGLKEEGDDMILRKGGESDKRQKENRKSGSNRDKEIATNIEAGVVG